VTPGVRRRHFRPAITAVTQTQLIAAIKARVRAKPRVPNPPVSEEALVALESLLPGPLPRLFRRLYAAIGDGGFGPGYGLLRLAGVRHEYLRFRRIYTWWPGGLIPVLEWGCGIFSCLDVAGALTPVLRYDPDVEEGQARRVLGPGYVAPHLLPEAASLHGWLEAWLSGTPLFGLSPSELDEAVED